MYWRMCAFVRLCAPCAHRLLHRAWSVGSSRTKVTGSCASLMGVLRTEPSSSEWTIGACNHWSFSPGLLFLKAPIMGCRRIIFLKTENTLVEDYVHLLSLKHTPFIHFLVWGAGMWWQWSNGEDSQAEKTEKGHWRSRARTKKGLQYSPLCFSYSSVKVLRRWPKYGDWKSAGHAG